MTISFKGNHEDKQRINYKRVGDSFQCNAICQDGYCYDFIFRNEPVNDKYLEVVSKKEVSRLHARCVTLFNLLQNEYHQVKLDNLYNSGKFRKLSRNYKKKVFNSGVIRKDNRGVPSCIYQVEKKSKQGKLMPRILLRQLYSRR